MMVLLLLFDFLFYSCCILVHFPFVITLIFTVAVAVIFFHQSTFLGDCVGWASTTLGIVSSIWLQIDVEKIS